MPYLTDLFSKGFDNYTLVDNVVVTALSVIVSLGGVMLLAWIGERTRGE
jgi:hypothetical protein